MRIVQILGLPLTSDYQHNRDSHPRSWKNTVPEGGGASSSTRSAEKRFSMNYLDTIGDADPRSWRNTIVDRSGLQGGKVKRQVENFLRFRSPARFILTSDRDSAEALPGAPD